MPDTIAKLIDGGENQTTEFKSSLNLREEMGRALSAFANADGGTLLVGVSDQGQILGVEIGARTVEDLANWIKENTDPAIYPVIKVHQIEGKSIIAIVIRESEDKPVFFKDRAFQRVGKTSQRISSGKIRELAQAQRVRLHWDEQACESATLADIDEDKVEWYLSRRQEIRSVRKPRGMNLETLLINLKAAVRMKETVQPTHAGILFFGKQPQQFILQSQLRLARFAGTSLTRDFLDRADYRGTLWEMIEKAEDFIRRNTRLFGFRTDLTFRRIDKPEYPMQALREGLLNALIHRSYEEPADTRVVLFDERLEIISPGAFPREVSPDQPHHVPVNPVLCQLIYDIGFIEKYGTGIYMIRELCEEYGVPRPEYEMHPRETKLVFRSGGKAVILSEIERLGIQLNSRQRTALAHALQEGDITNRVYRELNTVSNKTASLELKDMVDKRLLRVQGQGRSSRYVPMSQGND